MLLYSDYYIFGIGCDIESYIAYIPRSGCVTPNYLHLWCCALIISSLQHISAVGFVVFNSNCVIRLCCVLFTSLDQDIVLCYIAFNPESICVLYKTLFSIPESSCVL